MENHTNEKTNELSLPVDRRSKVKDAGDSLLRDVAGFKAFDGVEEEFFYEIPKALRTRAEAFETQVKKWDKESSLSAPEVSVACAIFRKARIAAETRGFMELADWLATK